MPSINKRQLAFSARREKRNKVLSKIQNLRRSQEIRERRKFRKMFKDEMKEKDEAEKKNLE